METGGGERGGENVPGGVEVTGEMISFSKMNKVLGAVLTGESILTDD